MSSCLATELIPGDVIRFSKLRGVLGSMDRTMVVATTPQRGELYPNRQVVFTAYEYRPGCWARLRVCVSAVAMFEVEHQASAVPEAQRWEQGWRPPVAVAR